MTPIYIIEDGQLDQLYPLTYSRPAFLLRCGAYTLLDRMMYFIHQPISGLLVRDRMVNKLRQTFKLPINPKINKTKSAIFINGRWLMDAPFAEPKLNSAAMVNNQVVWMHLSADNMAKLDLRRLVGSKALNDMLPHVGLEGIEAKLVEYPWDLLKLQHQALLDDFARRGRALDSQPLPGTHLLNPDNMNIARDVTMDPGAVLDARKGPIMIESGTQIGPNAVVTGPVFIGRDCVIRTGADIRGDTSIGRSCRIGGEVVSSIFFANSNKQHYGFVGHSVVGEWVNLGAGVTTSNLKNTYGSVRMTVKGADISTDMQFLGSVIGDHAKLAVGVYLSTGTVIGFSSHILVSRPPKYVPSFAWVTDRGVGKIDLNKALQIAKIVMARREQEFTEANQELFLRIAQTWSTEEAAS
ncbi:MAG: putative sugar nucleotidyl transferase [Phycisphaerae bacterium]